MNVATPNFCCGAVKKLEPPISQRFQPRISPAGDET